MMPRLYIFSFLTAFVICCSAQISPFRATVHLMSGDLGRQAEQFCVEFLQAGLEIDINYYDFQLCTTLSFKSLQVAENDFLRALLRHVGALRPSLVHQQLIVGATLTVTTELGGYSVVIPHGWEFQSYLVREFCMSVWTRPNCFDLILAAVTKYRTGCEIHVMRHLGVIRDAEPDVYMTTLIPIEGKLFRFDFDPTAINVHEYCSEKCRVISDYVEGLSMDDCVSVTVDIVHNVITTSDMQVSLIVEDKRMFIKFNPTLSSPHQVALSHCSIFCSHYPSTDNGGDAVDDDTRLADCTFPVAHFLRRFYSVEELRHWSVQTQTSGDTHNGVGTPPVATAEVEPMDSEEGRNALKYLVYRKSTRRKDLMARNGPTSMEEGEKLKRRSPYSDVLVIEWSPETTPFALTYNDGENVSAIEVADLCNSSRACVSYVFAAIQKFESVRQKVLWDYIFIRRGDAMDPQGFCGVVVPLVRDISLFFDFNAELVDVEQMIYDRCVGANSFDQTIPVDLCVRSSTHMVHNAIATRDMSLSVIVSDVNIILKFNPSKETAFNVAHRTCLEHGTSEGFHRHIATSGRDSGIWEMHNEQKGESEEEGLAACIFPLHVYLQRYYTLDELRASNL